MINFIFCSKAVKLLVFGGGGEGVGRKDVDTEHLLKNEGLKNISQECLTTSLSLSF